MKLWIINLYNMFVSFLARKTEIFIGTFVGIILTILVLYNMLSVFDQDIINIFNKSVSVFSILFISLLFKAKEILINQNCRFFSFKNVIKSLFLNIILVLIIHFFANDKMSLEFNNLFLNAICMTIISSLYFNDKLSTKKQLKIIEICCITLSFYINVFVGIAVSLVITSNKKQLLTKFKFSFFNIPIVLSIVFLLIIYLMKDSSYLNYQIILLIIFSIINDDFNEFFSNKIFKLNNNKEFIKNYIIDLIYLLIVVI